MIRLTGEQVKHVAKLANLVLAKDEIGKFQEQLLAILEYVKILNQVDTKNVGPTSQVTGLKNVFREDEPGGCLFQKEALSGAKNGQAGMFKTKAILE